MQNVVLITSCRISQIKHRNIVAIVLACDSAIISCYVPFGVRTDERHSACASKFNVRVQEICGFAHARSAYHKRVNIAVIYNSHSFFAVCPTAYHRTLNSRQVLTFSPHLRLEWQRDKSTLYLSFCRPPRSSVLSIADFFCLYSVKRLVVKQIYDYQKCNKNHCKHAY